MSNQCHDARYMLKVEMKNLALNDYAKNKILDTLKFVRGEEFVYKDYSAYKDKKLKLNRQFWIERGNLVVHGGQKNTTENGDPINHFALSKLERYGFYKGHCLEALKATNGDVGSAYELLMCRYFSLSLPEAYRAVAISFMVERTQELNSLRSIFDEQCEERLPNTLWVIHIELPYLGQFYNQKKNPTNSTKTTKKKDVCRFYLRGQCRFGPKCRFSHEDPVEERQPQNVIVDENANKFELEIRFPPGCQYPMEIPFVSFVAKSKDFPPATCLTITNRLLAEAHNFRNLLQPCVYDLIDLLKQEDEILKLLEKRNPVFYDHDLSLFSELDAEEKTEEKVEESSISYMYNSSNSEKKIKQTPEQLLSVDAELKKKYYSMVAHERYPDVLARRKELPAWNMSQQILDLINKNQVVIVSGETGCGKSTQIPQFILDEWFCNNNSEHIEIICTQPRRISAIGVSERVASERLERIGETVGYQIRLDTRTSNKTRLTFCTTGILLRKLERDPFLENVSHIIVDEVHERNVESDFLLLILRDLIIKRPEVKVILMSATINSELFVNYFNNAPTIEIPGRAYPVEQLFLEDIIPKINYILEEHSGNARRVNKTQSRDLETMDECDGDFENAPIKGHHFPNPETNDEYLPIKQLYHRYSGHPPFVRKTIFLTDTERVDFILIERIIEFIVDGDHQYPREGSILVFLPGIGEIKEMMAKLEGNPNFSRRSRFVLIPLHSTLTNEEQALVFKKLRPGDRKIVLSTNIAETSITIDDCVFVIDCGKMKEKGFDSNKNMESLELVNESRANALQRKGRAGRVMPGVCFHTFTRHRFEYVFTAQPVPEIRRVPLEQLILRIKTLPNFENKELHDVINHIIEPPTLENVLGAVERLKNVGALNEKGDLTALGKHLASLPVDVRIGKLILYGAMFCALDSALTMAAFLSHKSPFITHFNRDENVNKKKKFITGNSDHLTTLNAYKCWLKAIEKQGPRGGFNFARDNGLSGKTLSTLADMKHQYLELLGDIGFLPDDINISRRRHGVDKILELTGPELNINGENQRLLASILCASLYPNIVKVLTPRRTYQETIGGAIPQDVKPEDLLFVTKSDGDVLLHPSSVNSTIGDYPFPYLVYQEKIKTSKVFIRDCTMVPVMPLVLFSSGNVRVELNRSQFFVSLDDGWTLFPVPSNETAEILEAIRTELNLLLDEKIREPKLNLQKYPKGKRIIDTIVYLISNCS